MDKELFTYPLYLFYGLPFFALGVAITSKDIGASTLKVAKIFWLFALFAYSHALGEWFELYLILFRDTIPAGIQPTLHIAKLSLILVSFSALFLFGVALLRRTHFWKPFRAYPLLALLIILWGATLLFHGLSPSPSFFRFASISLRNIIGGPGAEIAGIGFILFSRSTRSISAKGALNFLLGGVALMIYGILAGVIPSQTTLPLIDIHVELLRGISAFLILYFIMNALHIFDIEQSSLIEDRLNHFAQSEKLAAIGKLAAGIAHEINNPLTNISLNVEMLKKEVVPLHPQEARLEKRFATIQRNLTRASRIAQELLYFSQEREGEFVPTDLNAVISGTLILLVAQTNDYRIELELGKIPLISAIPWKLEEVFLNLLLNSMEAKGREPRIVVTTRQKDGEVVVEVADTGIGIPSRNLNFIFDPFYTTKEVGKGTGLGLAVCYGIMEMHKGRIEVQSQEGKGTTVRLFFPEEEDHDPDDFGG
jgi:two-component system NtrC family sensor kinase